MTLNVSLSPESEARLRQRASAEGKDVEDVVRETVEAKLAQEREDGSKMGSLRQGTPEWFAKFREWIDSDHARSFLADDSRDAIYCDEPD